GNKGAGFFTETFDLNYPDSSWHVMEGNWGVESGYLKPQPSTLNAGIYQLVAQNTAPQNLYHWEGKILGAGTQRKCQFYFKANVTTANNVTNGYMIDFRPDAFLADVY